MIPVSSGSIHDPRIAGIVLFLGLVVSAFFSGSETGYMSVSRVRLRRLARDNSAIGRRLLSQLRRIEDPILTCLIGTNLSNVVLSAVATMVLTEHYGQKGEWLAVILVGTLVIFFGEIIPKVLYREFPESMTLASAPAIALSMLILAPVRWALNGYTVLLHRTLPGDQDGGRGELDRRSLAALLISHSVTPRKERRYP